MTVSAEDRARVRSRAGFRCEYCGVHENDVGGELTIDHFQPKSRGGTDDLENLVYCCICCNQHKHDYWPERSEQPSLWNPRHEESSLHVLELEHGRLQALTPTGAFSIERLRLNRPPLIAYRLRQRRELGKVHLLRRYAELNDVIQRLLEQQAGLIEGLHHLLGEQQQLLRRLLDDSA